MKQISLLFVAFFLSVSLLQAQNPYAALGIEEKVLHYDDNHSEMFLNDTIKPIGYGLYSPKLGLLALYDLTDSLVALQRIDPSQVARWLGVDPKANEYPQWSPYNYTLNNPILFIDPDGRSPEWVPGITTYSKRQDNELKTTTAYLTIKMEQGDNANTLASFLNVGKAQAESIMKTMDKSGVIRLPDDIQGVKQMNMALQDAYADNPDSYTGNTWFSTNYTCFSSAISIAREENPVLGNNMQAGAFDNILSEEFVNTNTPEFGKTLIRFKNGDGEVTHAATFLGASRDGTIYTFSKNGATPPPSVRTQKALEAIHGKASGQKKDTPYYNPPVKE